MVAIDRLLVEKEIVRTYTDFEFREHSGVTTVTGWVRPRAGGINFQVRVDLTPGFPFERPPLYIGRPELWTRDRKSRLIDIAPSRPFHMYSTDATRLVRLCHTSKWDASVTCMKVLSKGILWCQAYSEYLETGEAVASILVRLYKQLTSLEQVPPSLPASAGRILAALQTR